MAVAASAGIAVGLLVVALLAVTAGVRGRPPVAPGPRAIAAAALTYLVLVAPVLTVGGVDLITVLVLIIGVILPIVTGALSGRSLTSVDGAALRIGTVAVAIGLVAVLLVAAGQTMSLLGRVSPTVATVTVAVVAALIAVANGLRGTARAGRWLFWVLVGLAVPFLAAGAYLGRPGDLAAPVVPVTGLPVTGYLALGIGLAALGVIDPALRGYLAGSGPRSPWWAAGLLAGILLALGLGLLLVYGGSLVAPSLAFFILPANLGAVPGGLAAGLAIVTFLLATCIAAVAAGAATRPTGDTEAPDAGATAVGGSASAVAGPPGTRVSVPADPVAAAGVVAAALVLALLPLRSEYLLLATVLAGVAAATALLLSRPAPEAGTARTQGNPRAGVATGLVVAVVAAVVIAITGIDPFGPAGLLAVLVTAAVSAAAGRLLRGASGDRVSGEIPVP